MTGILMGAETQDSHGKPFVLVVPDVSVYDPAMSDSLIPVGRLIEAGFIYGQPQNPISGQRRWIFPQNLSALRWHRQ